jgi:hypothetical protein
MREIPISSPRRFQILVVGWIAGLFLIPLPAAWAQCASVLRDGNFESQRSGTVNAPWVSEGRTGIDIRRSLSHGGANNAWARHNTGWNAIRQTVRLSAGVNYTLRGFVRTSGNVQDGYFGFRDSAQRPVSEIKYGPLPTYQELRVQFRPTRTDTYNLFTGFWAPNADGWIQIDDLRVDFPCEDVVLNPVDD